MTPFTGNWRLGARQFHIAMAICSTWSSNWGLLNCPHTLSAIRGIVLNPLQMAGNITCYVCLVVILQLYPYSEQRSRAPTCTNDLEHPIGARAPKRERMDSFSSPVMAPQNIPLEKIECRSKDPVASGGFSDIYTGTWDNRLVGIKVVRIFSTQDTSKIEKRLMREISIWHSLQHPNISKFYGVTNISASRTGLVMHWYVNGPTPEYITRKKGYVNIESILMDIAQGIHYLHTQNPPIIHGDLKGYNTLVTDDERIVLCDFGLSRIVKEAGGPSGQTTNTVGGSIRFQAPELLDDDIPRIPADIYEFGCTVYELVSGHVPFNKHKTDWSIILALTKGELPWEGDEDIIFHHSNGLRELLLACWQFEPQSRPDICSTIKLLEDVRISPLPSWRFQVL